MIRPAEPADYEAMDQVFRASAKALCTSSYDREDIEAWAGEPWPERFVRGAENGNQHYVLLIDNQVVCFGALNIETQLLVALFVAPELAGKGVGTKMMCFLLAAARDADIKTLQVDSSLNAVEFYARHGFVEQSRGEFTTQSGVVLASVKMSCELNLLTRKKSRV